MNAESLGPKAPAKLSLLGPDPIQKSLHFPIKCLFKTAHCQQITEQAAAGLQDRYRTVDFESATENARQEPLVF